MEGLTFYTADANIREVSDSKIRGTFAVFYDPQNPGTECQPFPDDTIERLAPGCMDHLLGQDVKCYLNHTRLARDLLGRTPHTLRLYRSAKGYDFEVDTPDTEAGRTARILSARGDLRGCSYGPGSAPTDVSITRENGKRILTVRRFPSLDHICLTQVPAYTATSIQREWHDKAEQDHERYLTMLQMIQETKNLR